MKRADLPPPTEHEEQVCVIQWWALASRSFKIWEKLLFAIPNGGQRHIAVAAKMKAEGVRPSVPDLMLAVPRGGFHGLFLEMKKMGERPRLAQTEFIWNLREQGYKALACQGADDAIGAISAYVYLPTVGVDQSSAHPESAEAMTAAANRITSGTG